MIVDSLDKGGCCMLPHAVSPKQKSQFLQYDTMELLNVSLMVSSSDSTGGWPIAGLILALIFAPYATK